MNLKIKRITLGLSQVKLAELSNVSRSTISKLEKGNIESIKLGSLMRIAQVLNMTVQELFLSEEENQVDDIRRRGIY